MKTNAGVKVMASPDNFDRAAALKEFDEAKTGVRGIFESGATTLPPIFRHPVLRPRSSSPSSVSVPTIDLSLPRPDAVALASAAARDWGFFQVVNHNLPLFDRTISAVRAFHEQPPSVRSAFYSRSPEGGVSYSSNVDLYRSSAASWRDTIQLVMGPTPPDPARIPPVCREELLAWDEHVVKVGRELMGLLSEGLGADAGLLEGMSCLEGRVMVCHYYPPCPEPESTVGLAEHTDPGVLTVLVQDSVGGLQIKWKQDDGEFVWVDVHPVPGALVINVGDLLQIMSNDTYKSVEHRVLASSHQQARVSIATFFNPGKRGESVFYGPLPALVSPDKPAKYRNFTMTEFMGTFFKGQLASRSLVEHFKL
ncbi:1-aminocyclopropane-1-carboxylate oxidase [Canna indica]|uniref:1-aminocyclopropane-1-carboxylate oxidase n=1 Tax=Canna indica TaxID=4628 RepID=A0AAQ3KHQ6_9LILI|nr:1-aminocyclopropane-1-carboxylate oxidase [Canna indica]